MPEATVPPRLLDALGEEIPSAGELLPIPLRLVTQVEEAAVRIASAPSAYHRTRAYVCIAPYKPLTRCFEVDG